jgi:hypothetical protein
MGLTALTGAAIPVRSLIFVSREERPG